MIRSLLVIQVPDPRDKRSVAPTYCPVDRVSLRSKRCRAHGPHGLRQHSLQLGSPPDGPWGALRCKRWPYSISLSGELNLGCVDVIWLRTGEGTQAHRVYGNLRPGRIRPCAAVYFFRLGLVLRSWRKAEPATDLTALDFAVLSNLLAVRPTLLEVVIRDPP